MEEKKIWTFESLAQCSRSELDNVLAARLSITNS